MVAKTPAQGRFVYRPRQYDSLMQRAQQSASGKESYVKQDIKFFSPKDGVNRIRILPPTWPTPEHYGYDLFLHFGVGADKASYICLMKHKNEACYPDELLARATTDQERQDLKAKRRVGVFLIDRDRESEGPMFWAMPWSLDKDILLASADQGTREVYPVDDPVNGYDVYFTKTGQMKQTKYAGVQVARRASPLHADAGVAGAWLEYVMKNPIPDILQFYSNDHIKKVMTGGVEERTEAEPVTHLAREEMTQSELLPPMPHSDHTPITVLDIAQMEIDELMELAVSNGISLEDLNDRTELEAAVAQTLGLTQPAPEPIKTTDALRERFKNLKSK